jgi:hypothetical protein
VSERAPGPSTIERCIAAWQRAKALLEADPSIDTDEQAIKTALDADPSVVQPDELLRRIVAAIVFAEAREAESKVIAASMRARQERYDMRSSWLRELLFDVMAALERRSFAAGLATVSIRPGKASVVITDEQALPDAYVRTKREPDRAALLEGLMQGEIIPGAVLSNPMPSVALIRPRPKLERELLDGR